MKTICFHPEILCFFWRYRVASAYSEALQVRELRLIPSLTKQMYIEMVNSAQDGGAVRLRRDRYGTITE
jgi:hypothetical protein